MQIYGFYNIIDHDFEEFYDRVRAVINELQTDGQQVEIQYQACCDKNGCVAQTALIIGRK